MDRSSSPGFEVIQQKEGPGFSVVDANVSATTTTSSSSSSSTTATNPAPPTKRPTAADSGSLVAKRARPDGSSQHQQSPSSSSSSRPGGTLATASSRPKPRPTSNQPALARPGGGSYATLPIAAGSKVTPPPRRPSAAGSKVAPQVIEDDDDDVPARPGGSTKSTSQKKKKKSPPTQSAAFSYFFETPSLASRPGASTSSSPALRLDGRAPSPTSRPGGGVPSSSSTLGLGGNTPSTTRSGAGTSSFATALATRIGAGTSKSSTSTTPRLGAGTYPHSPTSRPGAGASSSSKSRFGAGAASSAGRLDDDAPSTSSRPGAGASSSSKSRFSAGAASSAGRLDDDAPSTSSRIDGADETRRTWAPWQQARLAKSRPGGAIASAPPSASIRTIGLRVGISKHSRATAISFPINIGTECLITAVLDTADGSPALPTMERLRVRETNKALSAKVVQHAKAMMPTLTCDADLEKTLDGFKINGESVKMLFWRSCIKKAADELGIQLAHTSNALAALTSPIWLRRLRRWADEPTTSTASTTSSTTSSPSAVRTIFVRYFGAKFTNGWPTVEFRVEWDAPPETQDHRWIRLYVDSPEDMSPARDACAEARDELSRRAAAAIRRRWPGVVRTAEDLCKMDNAQWGSVMVEAAEPYWTFHQGVTNTERANRAEKIPIVLQFAGSRWLDRHPFLLPAHLRSDSAEMDDETRAFIEATGRSPLRQSALIPAAAAERLGLPADMAISMGATLREGAEEPPPIDMDTFFLPKGRAGHNMDLSCSMMLRYDAQLRDLFLQCRVPRTLALGVKKFQADGRFEIKSWLREQCVVPFSLLVLPFFSFTFGRPVIKILGAVSFKSWDLYIFARDILLDLVQELVEEHGEEYVKEPENLASIGDEWWRRMWEGRAGHDAKGKKRSIAPFEFRRAVETAGRWDDGVAEQHCSCGGSDGFHSEAKVFGREEIYDGMCLAHYLLMALRSKAPLEQRLRWRSYARGFVAFDAKRKLQLSHHALISLAQAPQSLVFQPVTFTAQDLQTARESLKTGSFEQQWLDDLRGATGLKAAAIFMKPVHDTTPTPLRILQARSALGPSLNVLGRYDAAGKVAGYSSAGNVTRSPAYLHGGQSSHLGVTGLCLAAVQLHRIKTTASSPAVVASASSLIQLTERVLDKSYELEKACRLAGRGGGERVLSPRLIAVDQEMRMLVMKGTEGRDMPALRAMLSSTTTSSNYDIKRHTKLYARSPSNLRKRGQAALAAQAARVAQNQEGGAQGGAGSRVDDDEDEEALAQSRDAGRLANNLSAALSQVENMSEDGIAVLVKQFRRIAKLINERPETKYKLVFDGDGLPLVFWEKGTPPKDVFEFVVRVWIRGHDKCDRRNQERLGFICWDANAWWRLLVMWLLYYAKYGRRCSISGLLISLAGLAHHPLNATLLAHLDHTRRFFEGTEKLTLEGLGQEGLDVLAKSNATVQLWQVNKLLRSYHISVLLAIFSHSRVGARAVVERLQDGLEEERADEVLEKMTGDVEALSSDVVEQLLNNSGSGVDAGADEDDDDDDDEGA